MGLPVESLTLPSAPGHMTSSALIDSVLGNFILTAVTEPTRLVLMTGGGREFNTLEGDRIGVLLLARVRIEDLDLLGTSRETNNRTEVVEYQILPPDLSQLGTRVFKE